MMRIAVLRLWAHRRDLRAQDRTAPFSRVRGRARLRRKRRGRRRPSSQSPKAPPRPLEDDWHVPKLGLFVARRMARVRDGTEADGHEPGEREAARASCPSASVADTEERSRAAERGLAAWSKDLSLRARRRAARDRRRDDPPDGGSGNHDLDRDRQADRPVGARMGARGRSVSLVRRGGAPHLWAHRSNPASPAAVSR